jgi:hypothetical protein
MSVKSSTELMLYVVLTMPTLNKAYLLLLLYPSLPVVCCNTSSRVVVVGDESGSSALDALYFIDLGLSMWIPHSRGILTTSNRRQRQIPRPYHLQKSLVEQSRKQHHEEGKFHPSLPSTQHPKLWYLIWME